MKPFAFVRECERLVAEQGQGATVTLVFPGDLTQWRRRSLWRGGPKGEVIGEAGDGQGILVRYRAAAILRALDREAERNPD